MLVRVVLMRTLGVKRSREEVLADPGKYGELFKQDDWASLVVAPEGGDRATRHPAHYTILPTLYRARLKALKLDDFLLVGREIDPGTQEPFPQGWWCRLAQG